MFLKSNKNISFRNAWWQLLVLVRLNEVRLLLNITYFQCKHKEKYQVNVNMFFILPITKLLNAKQQNSKNAQKAKTYSILLWLHFLCQQQITTVESANRKCAWFGSPAKLLSGILNLLSAQKCNIKHFSLTSIKTASIY